jgi:hypothetical protein
MDSVKLPSDFTLERYGLFVRLVNEDDAEFIVSLRTDEKLGRFIHKTDDSVSKQKEWTVKYKEREKEGLDFYFMFEDPKTKTPYGVCRLYDIQDDCFTIGSWVFSKNSPKGSAILGDIITREVGHELYPESLCLWDTKKMNTNVIRYGRSYHPQVVRETEDTFYFSCTRSDNEKYKQLYLRMLLK